MGIFSAPCGDGRRIGKAAAAGRCLGVGPGRCDTGGRARSSPPPADTFRYASAEQRDQQQAKDKPQQAVMAQGLRRFSGELPHDAAHHVGKERPEGSFKCQAETKGAKDELRGGSHAGMMTGAGRFVKDEKRLRRPIPDFPA